MTLSTENHTPFNQIHQNGSQQEATTENTSIPSQQEARILKSVSDLCAGKLKFKDLDKEIKNPFDAVLIRRAFLLVQCQGMNVRDTFSSDLPFENYDYSDVMETCCENAFGYIPVPVGLAGQVNVDGTTVYLPLATTEGALVASVSRGCKAINMSGGATTAITSDAMTRAPCLRLPSLARAVEAKRWIESSDGFKSLQDIFRQSSNHCRLIGVSVHIVGYYIYPRFQASTGDAMGMNMITHSIRNSISMMQNKFNDLEIISLSGNLCADKKPAAVNWVEGRGKGVIAQCRLSSATMSNLLKTDAKQLASLNTMKNHVGSAMAGASGGFNAQASNIVTAMYLATGQDVAQNVESSQCITTMEE